MSVLPAMQMLPLRVHPISYASLEIERMHKFFANGSYT
jgi:hypothetical protein